VLDDGWLISDIRYQLSDIRKRMSAISDREAELGLGSSGDRTRISGFLIADI
jgi:hypothetical protein